MQSHLGMFIVLLDSFEFFFLLAGEKAKKPKLTVKYKDFFVVVVGERFEGMLTIPVYSSDKVVITIKLFGLSVLAKYYC